MTASSLESRIDANLHVIGYGDADLLVQKSRRSLRSWLPWFVKVRIGIDLCDALSVAIGRIRMLCRDLDLAESTLRRAGWTRRPGTWAWDPPPAKPAAPKIDMDVVDKASAALSTVQTSLAALQSAAMARSQAPSSPPPPDPVSGPGWILWPAGAGEGRRVVLTIDGPLVQVHVERTGSAGQPT